MVRHAKQQRICFLSLAIVFALSGMVFAEGMPPGLVLTAGPLMDPMMVGTTGTDNGDGTFDYDGMWSAAMWDMTWDMTVDTDPFVQSVIGFTNTSGMTQNFTVAVSLPISPSIPSASLIGGSMGGSVTDANSNGICTLATVSGTPLFSGDIDGAAALPIYPDPNSWTASFAGQTMTINAQNPGLPGPTLPGPAAINSIGITYTFSLTPGDSVALTSYFEVQPVPEPNSLVLLSLGVCAMAFFRRRK